MSQQPYQYPPQYPTAPPQQYPPQQYPPQQYAPAPPQQYPPQQYAPPTPPQQPLAQGSLADFYNQPSVGGPAIGWTNPDKSQKPVGTSYVGVVARDVTLSDVMQETDMQSGRPATYRDGRPIFKMRVPLRVEPSQEFPNGEASWFVKGQAKDELVRAMAEVGLSGNPPPGPKAGAGIRVTLVQRRPSGPGRNPANIVQVQYVPAPGEVEAHRTAQQPSAAAPSPAAEQAPAQQAPLHLPPPVGPPQQYPERAYVTYDPPQPQNGAPPAPQGQTVGLQADPPQQAPQQAQGIPQQPLAAPEGLSPELAELLARMTGGTAPTGAAPGQ